MNQALCLFNHRLLQLRSSQTTRRRSPTETETEKKNKNKVNAMYSITI